MLWVWEDSMSDSTRRFLAGLVGGLAVLAATLPSTAVAALLAIDFQVSALGSSRYQYRYTVTNVSPVSSPTLVSGFTVDFDPALYEESTLLITSAGLADWSEQILGSVDLGSGVFFSPAQYDAYKIGGAPLGAGDSATGFTVEFTWLGAGTPGSQAFSVFDPVTLDVIETGPTQLDSAPAVPEPSSITLGLLALFGAVSRQRGVARRIGSPLTPPAMTGAERTA
jgi:hypothetical protein